MKYSRIAIAFTLLVSMLGGTAFAAPALTASTDATASAETAAPAVTVIPIADSVPTGTIVPTEVTTPSEPIQLDKPIKDPVNPKVKMPTDIAGHPAKGDIEDFIARGYIKGYFDGTFKPEGQVTRAEFMSMINKVYNFTVKADISFSDVAAGDWYYDEIAKAKAAGCIAGYEDGTMRPDGLITHQEVATIFYKLKNLSADETSVAGLSDAAKVAPWAKGAVGAVVKAGVMRGNSINAFMPEKKLVRGDAVTIARISLAIMIADPAASLNGPAVPAVPAVPATPAIPAAEESPATPAVPSTPAIPAIPADDGVIED